MIDGIQKLHENYLIHRDIKPKNYFNEKDDLFVGFHRQFKKSRRYGITWLHFRNVFRASFPAKNQSKSIQKLSLQPLSDKIYPVNLLDTSSA